MPTYTKRSDIPEKYTWDLSSIFATDADFESALKTATKYPEKLAAYKGKISKSADDLLAFLQEDDQIGIALDKLITYAQRKGDEDTRAAKYQAYISQVISVYTQVSASESWFSSELLTLTDAQMDAFYKAQPKLELYRRALDLTFRQRPHTLSAPEEALLAKAGDMASQPENVFSMFNDADLTFADATDSDGKTHAVTHGSYIPLMMSHDRTLRESAFHSVYSAYGKFKNTSAAMLASQVKQLKFFSQARKYPTSLAYCLDQNEIPTSVYDNLISAVHDNLPQFYDYIALRKRVLGVDKLHYWDIYAPLVDDVDMNFTYEQACDLILKALEPMGPDYLALVRKGLSERWVDVYETPGKRSGAYSAGGYGMHPVILMNFQGKLDDVFTLIHEMGHSIHTYLSTHNQPPVYSNYAIFVAEVASTCNEALLSHYLLAHEKDPKKHAYILNHFLEQFRGTIYRQCMFAEFERYVNALNAKGEGITADALCKKYLDLNHTYYGSGVELDSEIGMEWARIPHFYYDYYVYQYSTGFAAAIALSQRIINEGAPAVKDYVGFLKGGCSKSPIDLLRGAGVDMSTAKPVNQALSYFAELEKQFEKEIA